MSRIRCSRPNSLISTEFTLLHPKCSLPPAESLVVGPLRLAAHELLWSTLLQFATFDRISSPRTTRAILQIDIFPKLIEFGRPKFRLTTRPHSRVPAGRSIL